MSESFELPGTIRGAFGIGRGGNGCFGGIGGGGLAPDGEGPRRPMCDGVWVCGY